MAENDNGFSLKDLPSEAFEAILGSISDGVFTVDRMGRITCFNRAATAEAMGIHKATLHRKIRKLGIELPPEDGRSVPREDG
jgi:transcriptional regulator with PAS, ATPase and Fis domain